MERTHTAAGSLPRCDLVMKGGVASGIVYPDAIYEISRRFDIKSIGGTSAGAIAAALGAAAQYRRLRERGEPAADAGFDRIRTIPETLGAGKRLLKLFTPNRATRALFNIVADVFSPRKPRWIKALCLVRAYPIQAAIGALPALLYAYAAFATAPPMRIVHWLVALAIGILGSVAGGAVSLVWDALRKLPGNCYGLVSGITDGRPNDTIALDAWLTNELEATAGIDPGTVPLTFGMLWNPLRGPVASGIETPPTSDRRAIDLQMVTTCLTQGRPYRFPTRTSRFYFKPEELRAFFPPHVVRWMCERARADAAPLEGLVALPPIGDLPVIVATRMSLAFPLLLSAVPLYALDYTDEPPRRPQPVWFSDGGLTSNFPIQMFDSPLPRWPTLALNLGPIGPRTPPDDVVTIAKRSAGRLQRFVPVTGVLGFGVALFEALQNWNDAMQMVLPGFRDRIATIAMAPDEGGLNLEMDAATVARLRQRGADAARALIERFATPSELRPDAPELSWEGHRWTRLRVEFETLGEHLARFEAAYSRPWQPHDVSYAQLIVAHDPQSVPRRSYPLGDGQEGRAAAARVANGIVALSDRFAAAPGLRSNLPRPEPSLVVRPDPNR